MKVILLFLAACTAPAVVAPAPAQTTTGPTAAGDSNVVGGEGWTRIAPGMWQLARDNDRPSDTRMMADPGWRTLERVDLPQGAVGGQLDAIDVSYGAAGAATWTVLPDQGGVPGEAPLATLPVQITTDMVTLGGAPPRWTHHALVPAAGVGATFWLAFESPDGNAAVDAVNSPEAIVVYQAPAATHPDPLPYTPFVRVSLSNVH